MIRTLTHIKHLIILLMLFLISCHSSATGVKDVTQLATDEIELVNNLCKQTLEEAFSGNSLTWYNNTYTLLPTSDKGFDSDISKPIQLEHPIALSSVVITGPYISKSLEEKIRTRIKQRIYDLKTSYKGKTYRITEAFVIFETESMGGLMGPGLPSEKITIIPSKIDIS